MAHESVSCACCCGRAPTHGPIYKRKRETNSANRIIKFNVRNDAQQLSEHESWKLSHAHCRLHGSVALCDATKLSQHDCRISWVKSQRHSRPGMRPKSGRDGQILHQPSRVRPGCVPAASSAFHGRVCAELAHRINRNVALRHATPRPMSQPIAAGDEASAVMHESRTARSGRPASGHTQRPGTHEYR